MNHHERMACYNWSVAIMAEAKGKGQPSTAKVEMPSIIYKEGEIQEVIAQQDLPELLILQINRALDMGMGLYDIWPRLDDADLGAIMKAGAAKFLDYAEADEEV